MLRIDDRRASARRACELDRRFNSFAAAAAEIDFTKSAARQCAQTLGKFSSDSRNMALEHRRTASVQFLFECLEDVWMVVTGVMNAISRKKVQDLPAVACKKLASPAELVVYVHSQ